MFIYSNSNNSSGSNLFGDAAYKSVYNRKNIINRTQIVKRCTPQQQRTKKLTRENIKLLKNLGLRVKNH